MNHYHKQQAQGVYDEMAFASFDLLAPIKADAVLVPVPPFSAVLTDWLSMMAAEGVGS